MSHPADARSGSSPSHPRECLIHMRDITKRFPRVTANRGVELKVRQGQVHALVGENGAGKTTLMNILYGLVKPDSGQITLRGKRLPHQKGFLGLDYGIGMIHQHFMLIGRFTALENIILGQEPARGPLLDIRKARQRIENLMHDYGIAVDLDRRVSDLSVGEEQRVEILKVLYRDAEIIIMDEPTAVLTPQETKNLFATLKTMTAGGRTVIFITHKLEEVMQVAEAVTVMRGGRVVDTLRTEETDIPHLAQMMVGRSLRAMPQSKRTVSAQVVLETDDLALRSAKGQELLSGISLRVRGGEIFGICGVEGNGQYELFEVLVGLRSPAHGSIRFLGRDITHSSTKARLEAGLAHIPPDRVRMGLVAGFDLKENLILGRHTEEKFAGRVFLKGGGIEKEAAVLIREFAIEPAVPDIEVSLLSGGNQQKVIAARELSRQPELLIASQPTRGLDIGAARMIHQLLIKQAERGKSVLLISADLSEVMSLADRIGVMYRGRITGVLERGQATEDQLGLMMAGVNR